MAISYTDFYIKYPGHPRYNTEPIIESDVVEVVEQKLEMILFSTKGDLYGDPNFGADLEHYLWATRLDTPHIKKKIVDQINEYIPELNEIGYTLTLKILQGTTRDIMIVAIEIQGYNFDYVFI